MSWSYTGNSLLALGGREKKIKKKIDLCVASPRSRYFFNFEIIHLMPQFFFFLKINYFY
jgi:hypothetical protein